MLDRGKDWQMEEITPKNGNWNRRNGASYVPVNRGNYLNLGI
jgi:hypothetical protein